MKNGYLTFRSVTYAQRGEALLRKKGMDVILQRTPRWMEEQGCGYCLRMEAEQLPAAVRLLQANSLSYRRVYIRGASGELEAWTL